MPPELKHCRDPGRGAGRWRGGWGWPGWCRKPPRSAQKARAIPPYPPARLRAGRSAWRL